MYAFVLDSIKKTLDGVQTLHCNSDSGCSPHTNVNLELSVDDVHEESSRILRLIRNKLHITLFELNQLVKNLITTEICISLYAK